jgi:hypothetical protein
MDCELKKQLELSLGKSDILIISDFLVHHPDEIPMLIECFSGSSHNFKKNSGWALFHMAAKNAAMLLPFSDSLLAMPMRFHEDIILRNLLFVANRILKGIPTEVSLNHLDLYDYCMEVLVSEAFGPGTRCNAMSVMLCFCEIEPAFSSEFLIVLDTLFEESSIGLKNRMQKTRKQIEKIKVRGKADSAGK